ncbi:MAG: EAL domain-containing protein [Rhodospirillaceae bacterium]|nr:EAL domain-containing protein [Rhodospirillaceae bacterium]
MAEMVYSKRFEAGEVIFRSGDDARDAYIIESGKVAVSDSVDGKNIQIAELGAGEIFGEMSMIDDAPRSATVTAIEATEVIVIQRSRFQQPIVTADPLMNLLLRVVLNRFRDTQRQYSGRKDILVEGDQSLEEIRELALNRIKFEQDMRRGLEASEFELHYQPIIDLQAGHISGFEALIRWRKRDGEFIMPMEFISLAEKTGLIIELGRMALEQATEHQHRFASHFHAAFPDMPPAFMSVNISGLQLSEMDEIDHIAGIIKNSGVDPNILKLEITETLLVEDPEHATTALEKLKGLGVSIAIDDFGTGYSSLSYLHQFPLDTLKIDRAFVNNMDKSESSRLIVNSVAQLALALKMDIVAEGIEEKSQMDALRSLGCQYGQGYFIGKPASFEQTIELINSRPGW